MRLDHLLSRESDRHIMLDIVVSGTREDPQVLILFNFEGPAKEPQKKKHGENRNAFTSVGV